MREKGEGRNRRKGKGGKKEIIEREGIRDNGGIK